ncbi:MAG: hypothetical protein WC783_03610 [Candidatus Paceibacterota bacterium]|jgi:hypothetical protein
MDPQRQGEIALAMVRYFIRKGGIELSRQKIRGASAMAKAMGISTEELMEFTRPLVVEFVEELFPTKK